MPGRVEKNSKWDCIKGLIWTTIQKLKSMIDLFQDRRNFSNPKKKQPRTGLPEIKYSPTIARKLNDELLLSHPHSQMLYNYQPLSNILISKKINPPNPEQAAIFLSKKRPTQMNLHNFKIRKESAKKIVDNQKQQEEEPQRRLNSTSLSRLSHCREGLEECEEVRVSRASELTFLVGRGNNNEELVRGILLGRGVWKEVQAGEGVANFKWVFSKDKQSYKKMWSYNKKRAINHFEFNEEISTKDQLVKNLQIYCETKKIEVFSITPVTFTLDFDDEYCEYSLKQFLAFFLKNDPRKQRKGGWPFQLISKFQNYMARQNSDIKKRVNILSRPLNNSTYYTDNSYLWLLKPTGLNRGRGIEIFDSLEDLERILLEYLALMNRRKIKEKPADKGEKNQDRTIDRTEKQKESRDQKELDRSQATRDVMPGQSVEGEMVTPEHRLGGQKFKLNTCSFVIQKYVEKPFLIKQRKFDIRVWALLTDDLNVHFFKEGYMRTSAEAYSTEDIDNYFIHLTNNAIQKQSEHYGQFEDGNQLSFASLKDYLPEHQVLTIWNRIKEITYMAFSSVKKKVNANHRKNCFELFGLDFFVDNELKVWLIEVNENPCLECSSPLLAQLIPRMVNDLFRLTLDRIFERKVQEKAYRVEGYRDGDNLWEHLGQLMPNGEYSPNKKK